MSEVKRYGRIGDMVEATEGLLKLYPMMSVYVLASDFDRVTAERDAALGREAELESSYDELAASVGFSETRLDQTGDSPIDCANQLQQRLTESHQREAQLQDMVTAADERADLLEAALRTIMGSHRFNMPGLKVEEIHAICFDALTSKAALKPAEGGGDA